MEDYKWKTAVITFKRQRATGEKERIKAVR